MSRIHVNNFVTTTDGAITDSATSVDLVGVTGFPVIGSGVTANLTLQSGGTYEIVTATARTSNTLTIVRGAEGTTPVAWADGSSISIRPTADSFDRKEDLISGATYDDIGTPASGDRILLQDASDGGALKTADFSEFGGGGGISDGDKGDITVSSSGAVWTVDNDAITYAKIQNVSATDKLLGRSSSGAGDVEEIACTAAGRAILDDADASAQRTTLGLGTLATQSGTFSGTSSGTNTGDQTSIVGISGTKAEFDTAVSDGNILYVGDVTQYTDEMAQDAVGGMVDTTLVYTDGTPLLSRAALTGDVTASAGSNSTTIANDAVTYAKMQNVSATDKILGRSTSGAGDVEEIACTAAGRALIDDADASAQRTTLGLGTLATQSGTFSGTSSGTNTGDQTITLTGEVTGSGTGSFAATVALPSSATVATDDKVYIFDTSASDAKKYVTTQSIADLSLTFKTIAVSGQSNVVADSGTDTLTFAAGSNITITTDNTTDTITIAASGGGSSSSAFAITTILGY